MSGKVWAFVRRDFRMDLHSRFSLLFELLNIGLTLGSYFFLSRLMPGSVDLSGDYLSFVLVGLAANEAMFASLLGISRSFQLQQPSGVLKLLMFGETGLGQVLFCSSVYPVLRGAIGTLLYLLAGAAFGAFPLGLSGIPEAILVLFVSLFAFAALGVCAASFSVLFKYGHAVLWAIGSASWLLSGVVYPLALLPWPLRALSQLVPLTHALEGLRAAMRGAPLLALAPALLSLSLCTLLLGALGFGLFKLGLRRSRLLGTLTE